MKVVIEINHLWEKDITAKLEKIPEYIRESNELAGLGNHIVLTGPAPIWLYLKIAHALHGTARRVIYSSPVTGEIEIFNHSPSEKNTDPLLVEENRWKGGRD